MRKIITLTFTVLFFFNQDILACTPSSHQFVRQYRNMDTCDTLSILNVTVFRNWAVQWSDRAITSVEFFGLGQCRDNNFCDPFFSSPYYVSNITSGSFRVQVTHKNYRRLTSDFFDCVDSLTVTRSESHTCVRAPGSGCLSGLTTSGEVFKEGDPANICSPCDPDPTDIFMCQQGGGVYDWASCQCGQSPIVIDVLGNGYNLTSAASGVRFDINGDETQDQVAWSAANSDDAWLSLDRDGNGTIDSGKELFGNSTSQPAPPVGTAKNGFLALAVFDKTANGGNDDGKIDRLDGIFANLRLWQDSNHNGISESDELKSLTELGLANIDLDYRESRRTDEHGNRFKYRAKVRDVQDAQLGRWAWDVYLVVQQPNN